MADLKSYDVVIETWPVNVLLLEDMTLDSLPSDLVMYRSENIGSCLMSERDYNIYIPLKVQEAREFLLAELNRRGIYL